MNASDLKVVEQNERIMLEYYARKAQPEEAKRQRALKKRIAQMYHWWKLPEPLLQVWLRTATNQRLGEWMLCGVRLAEGFATDEVRRRLLACHGIDSRTGERLAKPAEVAP